MRNLREAIFTLIGEMCGCRRTLRVVARPGLMLMLLALSALAAGCRQKDLLMPQAEMCVVDVRFIWDAAPDASPEGMTLLFYPRQARGNFWRYDISGRDGGRIELPPGSYTLIALNNDLPGVDLTDISQAASAAAMAVASKAACTAPTGMLYEGIADCVDVDAPGACGPQQQPHCAVVECRPDSATTVYRVRIADAEGIEMVSSLDGVLEGCAAGMTLLTRLPLASTVGMAFPLLTDPSGRSARGEGSGFAADPDGATYSLTLIAQYYNGDTFKKKFDVTRQILNQPHPHNVEIIIDGIVFPENPSQEEGGHGSLGMDVGVDGWHIIEIELDSTNK